MPVKCILDTIPGISEVRRASTFKLFYPSYQRIAKRTAKMTDHNREGTT